MPFTIVQQDITKMKVNAIVNAANTDLVMGGGVCGAIFKAAGPQNLQAACNELAPIPTGEAVITPAFDLPCKYIIHVVGPVFCDWSTEQSEKPLRCAYTNSLQLAFNNKCKSIAFPLISSDIYGYPKAEALSVATSAIQDFLIEHDMNVYLAVLDKSALALSEKLLGEVETFIDEYYVDSGTSYGDLPFDDDSMFNKLQAPSDDIVMNQRSIEPLQSCCESIPVRTDSVDELIGNLDESFASTLLRLIDAKGKTDAEVYKRANIDRKLFSKIRTVKGYMPRKRTIIALALALELNLDQTEDLLKRAGYTISHSKKFDVIIEYFIINGKYDLFEINEVLFKYNQPLLGT